MHELSLDLFSTDSVLDIEGVPLQVACHGPLVIVALRNGDIEIYKGHSRRAQVVFQSLGYVLSLVYVPQTDTLVTLEMERERYRQGGREGLSLCIYQDWRLASTPEDGRGVTVHRHDAGTFSGVLGERDGEREKGLHITQLVMPPSLSLTDVSPLSLCPETAQIAIIIAHHCHVFALASVSVSTRPSISVPSTETASVSQGVSWTPTVCFRLPVFSEYLCASPASGKDRHTPCAVVTIRGTFIAISRENTVMAFHLLSGSDSTAMCPISDTYFAGLHPRSRKGTSNELSSAEIMSPFILDTPVRVQTEGEGGRGRESLSLMMVLYRAFPPRTRVVAASLVGDGAGTSTCRLIVTVNMRLAVYALSAAGSRKLGETYLHRCTWAVSTPMLYFTSSSSAQGKLQAWLLPFSPSDPSGSGSASAPSLSRSAPVSHALQPVMDTHMAVAEPYVESSISALVPLTGGAGLKYISSISASSDIASPRLVALQILVLGSDGSLSRPQRPAGSHPFVELEHLLSLGQEHRGGESVGEVICSVHVLSLAPLPQTLGATLSAVSQLAAPRNLFKTPVDEAEREREERERGPSMEDDTPLVSQLRDFADQKIQAQIKIQQTLRRARQEARGIRGEKGRKSKETDAEDGESDEAKEKERERERDVVVHDHSLLFLAAVALTVAQNAELAMRSLSFSPPSATSVSEGGRQTLKTDRNVTYNACVSVHRLSMRVIAMALLRLHSPRPSLSAMALVQSDMPCRHALRHLRFLSPSALYTPAYSLYCAGILSDIEAVQRSVGVTEGESAACARQRVSLIHAMALEAVVNCPDRIEGVFAGTGLAPLSPPDLLDVSMTAVVTLEAAQAEREMELGEASDPDTLAETEAEGGSDSHRQRVQAQLEVLSFFALCQTGSVGAAGRRLEKVDSSVLVSVLRGLPRLILTEGVSEGGVRRHAQEVVILSRDKSASGSDPEAEEGSRPDSPTEGVDTPRAEEAEAEADAPLHSRYSWMENKPEPASASPESEAEVRAPFGVRVLAALRPLDLARVYLSLLQDDSMSLSVKNAVFRTLGVAGEATSLCDSHGAVSISPTAPIISTPSLLLVAEAVLEQLSLSLSRRTSNGAKGEGELGRDLMGPILHSLVAIYCALIEVDAAPALLRPALMPDPTLKKVIENHDDSQGLPHLSTDMLSETDRLGSLAYSTDYSGFSSLDTDTAQEIDMMGLGLMSVRADEGTQSDRITRLLSTCVALLSLGLVGGGESGQETSVSGSMSLSLPALSLPDMGDSNRYSPVVSLLGRMSQLYSDPGRALAVGLDWATHTASVASRAPTNLWLLDLICSPDPFIAVNARYRSAPMGSVSGAGGEGAISAEEAEALERGFDRLREALQGAWYWVTREPGYTDFEAERERERERREMERERMKKGRRGNRSKERTKRDISARRERERETEHHLRLDRFVALVAALAACPRRGLGMKDLLSVIPSEVKLSAVLPTLRQAHRSDCARSLVDALSYTREGERMREREMGGHAELDKVIDTFRRGRDRMGE
ncbi:hypothetical protein KIPB_000549 [Kipferlia bialata]|uniref:Uncharacterized protein n=1 Tax=Kipferlia bialata TaxID=797122 RepID=A0A9K3CNN9_9EUKA|nr:hypothetical protein KIPB_000549 [Kipferlia bialata]|eukprot:g549.t1